MTKTKTFDQNSTLQQDPVYALGQLDTYLFAARMSGLYRSPDNGLSWENTFASFDQPLTVTAIALADHTVFAGVNGAVLRSMYPEESWQISGLSSPPPHVVVLGVSPRFHEDGFVVAGTAEDGVFVSTDRGESWIAWNFGLLDLHIFALAISPEFKVDRTLFAGTESGVFSSQNGGRGWREIPFPLEAGPVISLAISHNFAADQRLYAGTEKNGLFISDDRGLNWYKDDKLNFDASVNNIHIAALPNEEVWLLLEEQVLCSSDRGQNWTWRCDLPVGQLAMTMLPFSDSIIVGFADGSIQKLLRKYA